MKMTFLHHGMAVWWAHRKWKNYLSRCTSNDTAPRNGDKWPLRDEYDTIINPFLLQAISAWHGVVSTSGCAGPVSQPLVTGMYQSVAHLDQVLSMQCAWWWWWLVWELPCRLVLFFLPLLWISFSFLKFFLIGSRISRSFMRLMSLSVCLSMYHPRTFFCKIMRVFCKSSDLSRVSARCW